MYTEKHNAFMQGFMEKVADLFETSVMYPKGTNPKEIEDYEKATMSAITKGFQIGAGTGAGIGAGAAIYAMRGLPKRGWKSRLAFASYLALMGAIPGAVTGGAIGANKHKLPQHLKPIGLEQFRIISDSTPIGTTYKNTPKGLKRIDVSDV